MKLKGKKSQTLEKMSVEDFFDNIDSIQEIDPLKNVLKKERNGKPKSKGKKKVKIETPAVPSSDDSEQEDKNELIVGSHRKALINLEKTDPELFKFLEKNDQKLLNFDMAADESELDDDDEENFHKPSDELEIASDESDYEPEDGDGHKKKANAITLKMLKEWQNGLQAEEVSVEIIRNVIKAFNSALLSVSGDPNMKNEYIVEGAAIFNGIIQLCVLYLEKAIRKYLKLSGKAHLKEIQKCKRFSKVKNVLRNYLMDLTKLLESVSSPNILSVILKHLHQIGSVLIAFSSITKPVLKRLVKIWSTGEESVRIVAFLCILKIIRNQKDLFLNQALKTMYMEYVRNSKFVSPNTLPSINFMRRSLTELFLLDLNAAYHHVFVFIRQLAIHLRNAILLQKKEHFQQVYNWQYINSLKLWGDVISLSTVPINASTGNATAKSENKSKLQTLIYPLVSITVGLIKLKSSSQFFPLRFHCVKILIDLSRATKVYIPILPLVLEVLNSNAFNQEHKKLAMKPISFATILRIQKGHLDENSFRDEVVEQVFGLTLECLINECTSIAFPDLIVPHVMVLNSFVKKTKNPNYAKKLKQLTEKIIEQSKYIDCRRNKINLTLMDSNYIKSWEINLRTGQTPFEVFYNNWQSTNQKKLKRQKVEPEELKSNSEDEYEEHDYGNLPKIEAPQAKKSRKDGPVELFPSDEEDDDVIDFDVDSDNSFEDDDLELKIEQRNGKAKNSIKLKKIAEVNQESEDISDDDDDVDDEGEETFLDEDDIVEDLTDW